MCDSKGYKSTLWQAYVDKIKQEQKPMTREEAERKLRKVFVGPNVMGMTMWLPSALETLGLLKFDEVKKQVKWRSSMGYIRSFNEGFDPHVYGNGWTRVDEVKKEESETVRLPVDDRTYEIGSDTYGVKIESIVKALKAKGYRIYKGAYAKEL